MPLVIGIDSSTQSTKAELRDADSGALLATGRASHPATNPPISEQDPSAWWDALVEAVCQLGDARNDVVAISVAGQQHGLVLLDDAGDSIRPAKLWNDTTSAMQAASLVSELGADWWSDWTGVVPVAAFTVTKLKWIADNEPENLERVAKIMLPHDYLTWRLSGEHVTDRGDASGTGWFDATTNTTLLRPLELATRGQDWRDRVPKVLGPTDVAGPLLPAVAAELGLPETVVVAPGTGDNMGGALGLGLAEGDVVVSLGTSGTVYARAAERAVDISGAVAGFCDATGGFLPLVCTLNATKVTDTVATWLGTDAAGLATLAIEAGTMPIDPILVPYFDGERTPNRPESKGIMVGLTNETSRTHLARAAHDGVVCGLLDGLDALQASGARVDGRLLLVGGGARSVAYRQRLADISNREVLIPANEESVAVGASLQAAVVHGGKADFDQRAVDWDVRSADTVTPNEDADGPAVRERYASASSFDDGLCRPA
ncbi:MAG: xylulokinase [Acidimicrobiia bacterium]|nr:xylulokinase [Acidimicrobiia bacterium]